MSGSKPDMIGAHKTRCKPGGMLQSNKRNPSIKRGTIQQQYREIREAADAALRKREQAPLQR